MKRSTFDRRVWVEVVGELVSERTAPGDTITLRIIYRQHDKPQVFMKFESYDPEKQKLPGEEEITDFLEDSPTYEKIDDSTGKPLPDEFTIGSDWSEYINVRFGPLFKSIVISGGRLFKVETEGDK